MIRHFVEFQGKPYEALKNPSYVKLYFDEPRALIAMRRVEGGHPNAFPVKSPKRARHKLVHAAAFCAHFKINVDQTVMFQTPKMEGDMLTLDMNKTATVSRGAR